MLGRAATGSRRRNTKSAEQWRDSIDSAASDVPPDLRHAAFFEAEYAMVVLPQRITTREDYFKVRRPGRGVSLDRERRNAVWDVIGAYRASSSVNGAIDFGEAAAIAAALLEARACTSGGSRAGRRGAGPEPDALAVPPMRWSPKGRTTSSSPRTRTSGSTVSASSSGRYGIKIVGRSRRLSLNYRTTAQNLHFAVGVLEGGEYLDLEEEATEVDGYRSARTGPAPRLVATSSITEELEQSAEIVVRLARRRRRAGHDRHPGARRRPGEPDLARPGRAGSRRCGWSPTRPACRSCRR